MAHNGCARLNRSDIDGANNRYELIVTVTLKHSETIPLPDRGFHVDLIEPGQHRAVLNKLDDLGLSVYLAQAKSLNGYHFALSADASEQLAPHADTMNLCARLGLDTVARSADLEREIVLAMLAAPRALSFPSAAEFLSAVAIRRNIVQAARRTQLAFGTAHAERPPSHWRYDEDCGFTLAPGQPLIDALILATQPDAGDGRLYSFSCYRASEYVMLLGMAQELEQANPALLAALQQRWERRAIQSRAFHDTFLAEFGSLEAPLPPRFYVPGDRVWFRNPDPHSSDASGYEGSWVIYLGDGMFSNFWKRERPYSFADKCLEIYHWRDGTFVDAAGDLRMNEDIVEARMAQTRASEPTLAAVLERMMRLRDASGVYGEGGCLDFSREFMRHVCAESTDIVLPPG